MLVVGGGIGGMSTAIVLQRLGLDVTLVERDADWRAYGAGITITGPTFRALNRLGLLDEVLAAGYGGDGIRVCDINGVALRELTTPRPLDADVPGTGGILRTVLHRILADATVASGTRVRTGTTVSELSQDAGRVAATFSDGTMHRFDLLIGADGINSSIRPMVIPDAPSPAYTGQSCWRLTVPRTEGIERRHFFLGGPVKAGLTPVSRDEMYMFLLENEIRTRVRPERAHIELRELMHPFGGIIGELRDGLTMSSNIIVRPLEAFRLPGPWCRQHVLLIGDAAHPTTPQLASGAGMAIEDAVVLGQEIQGSSSIEIAFARFMQRRYERCRLIVDNSLEIGRREQSGAPIESQTALVEDSLKILAQPI
ncbi:MAG: FAD-dependent oxidoreductase [Pseudomonadota bacterium]